MDERVHEYIVYVPDTFLIGDFSSCFDTAKGSRKEDKSSLRQNQKSIQRQYGFVTNQNWKEASET